MLMAVTAPLWAIAGMATLLLPYRWRYRILMSWAWMVIAALRPLCGIHTRVYGLENLPQQACVVMAKHQSAWETLALPYWLDPASWVLKRSLLRIPFFGWGLKILRPIAIDRAAGKEAWQQILAQGERQLDEERWVIVFPEGTRVAPGERGRYRSGGAHLAIHTGRPIIPVAHNAGRCWPRRSLLRYPGEITVVFGPPIEAQGRSPSAVMAEVETWIETQMAQIDQPTDQGPANPNGS
ncbi:1-acyl-sn-glycerol-3-phosphate acyltransferase [Halorhodospira abdelmalekii]|nr:1-acyl-sn-glycerol-3-phosphate acyltransferase [Halorhodospira abdelmalekii]